MTKTKKKTKAASTGSKYEYHVPSELRDIAPTPSPNVLNGKVFLPATALSSALKNTAASSKRKRVRKVYTAQSSSGRFAHTKLWPRSGILKVAVMGNTERRIATNVSVASKKMYRSPLPSFSRKSGTMTTEHFNHPLKEKRTRGAEKLRESSEMEMEKRVAWLEKDEGMDILGDFQKELEAKKEPLGRGRKLGSMVEDPALRSYAAVETAVEETMSDVSSLGSVIVETIGMKPVIELNVHDAEMEEIVKSSTPKGDAATNGKKTTALAHPLQGSEQGSCSSEEEDEEDKEGDEDDEGKETTTASSNLPGPSLKRKRSIWFHNLHLDTRRDCEELKYMLSSSDLQKEKWRPNSLAIVDFEAKMATADTALVFASFTDVIKDGACAKQCLYCEKVIKSPKGFNLRRHLVRSHPYALYAPPSASVKKNSTKMTATVALGQWTESVCIDANDLLQKEGFQKLLKSFDVNPETFSMLDEDGAETVLPQRMMAYVVSEEGGTLCVDQPVPQLATEKDVLIRILRSGICSTDHQILNGYKEWTVAGILGHEFVGVVVSIGNQVETSWMNKRVVGEINVPCNTCTVCVNQHHDPIRRRNHCPNRSALGILNHSGTFADYVTLPAENLYLVPDNVPDAHAVFVEPVAAACRIIEQGYVKTGHRVAVIGDGKLGLLVAEVLSNYLNNDETDPQPTAPSQPTEPQPTDLEPTAPSQPTLPHLLARKYPIVVFGKHKWKLNLLSSSIQVVEVEAGVSTFADTFDVVIECSGALPGFKLATEVCQRGGSIVLKTTCTSKKSIATFGFENIMEKSLRVLGSRCGPFQKALELISQNKIHLDAYITSEMPFSNMNEAMEVSKHKDSLKVQVVMYPAGSERG